MAWEQKIGSLGALSAAVSMLSNQFKCVKITADNTFNLTTVLGEITIGVLQDKPDVGQAGEIMQFGVTKVTAGATLVAGNSWTANAAGLAVVPSIAGQFIAGKVIVGAATGELATVTVGSPNAIF